MSNSGTTGAPQLSSEPLEHPGRALQEHLAHQPEARLDFAPQPIGRVGGKPEIVIRVVMRQAERIGQRPTQRRDAGAGRSRHMNAAL